MPTHPLCREWIPDLPYGRIRHVPVSSRRIAAGNDARGATSNPEILHAAVPLAGKLVYETRLER
ncbi:hypothetical protein [Methylocaldum sp.]|uniref:hypothetical protein n=1 Tax=Methylocaldum sp. TaxID=1969727 RepID=UPI002D3B52ED|nr:hypothetical protein [Methylocaldum sp.]HYE36659.1 hypothetical protein [Methylocaldum sp.]